MNTLPFAKPADQMSDAHRLIHSLGGTVAASHLARAAVLKLKLERGNKATADWLRSMAGELDDPAA